MPFSPNLTQQNGYLHAGAITAVLDSACGYAALTMAAGDKDVLSVEFKVNLLAPAAGEVMLTAGGVVSPRRRFVAGHQLAACRAATTAWKPAICVSDSRVSASSSRSATAARTRPATAWPASVSGSRNDRRSVGSSSRVR